MANGITPFTPLRTCSSCYLYLLTPPNLEAMGSSLENVIKVTVFLADVKTEKNAMNEVYGKYFPKDAPSRSAFGVEFPDTATRVEIELVAWVP